VQGAFQAGARGYVTKDDVSEEIIIAIRQVLKGGVYASKKLARNFSKQTIHNWLDSGS
jgi:DNA-binding NarL/FixJ family response regulator